MPEGSTHYELSKTIDIQKHKLDRKKDIFSDLVKDTNNLSVAVSSAEKKFYQKNALVFPSKVAAKRKLKPTSSELNERAKVTRRKETYKAAAIIHGGTESSKESVLTGMLDTLSSHFNSNNLAKKILTSKQSLVKEINRNVLTKWKNEFFQSKENRLRSLNVYYSHHVMGKRKYINLRIANRNTVSEGVKLANYVNYKELSEIIRSVDIGNVQNVRPTLTFNCDDEPDGAYRSLAEYAQRLARFYLFVNREREDKLHVFESFPLKSSESFLFVMAFGGDGAPVSGTLFLLSFLNVGQRLGSSSETFLLMGANSEESSQLSRNFLLMVLSDVKYLESNVFDVEVNGQMRKVEFKLNE